MALFPDEGRINELTTVGGTGGNNLYVHLYTNPVVIDTSTKLSDLLEAMFTGYVPYHSTNWSAPVIDVNDDAYIKSPVLVFTGPTSGLGQMIHGFYVTIGSGPYELLWFVEAFPTPLPLELVTDTIPLQVQARLRNLAA